MGKGERRAAGKSARACGAGRARLEDRISEHLARERRGVVLAELLMGVRQRQRGAVHAPVLAAGKLQQEDMLVTRRQPGCSPTRPGYDPQCAATCSTKTSWSSVCAGTA